MTTNSDNPTGITNYDISRFAALPEWQHLAQALNMVALAGNAAGIGGGQDALVDAVGHLARGVAFMDCCPKCERITDDTIVDTGAAPFATDIDGHWIRGRYRCAQGHQWTCNHTLTFPALF